MASVVIKRLEPVKQIIPNTNKYPILSRYLLYESVAIYSRGAKWKNKYSIPIRYAAYLVGSILLLILWAPNAPNIIPNAPSVHAMIPILLIQLVFAKFRTILLSPIEIVKIV